MTVNEMLEQALSEMLMGHGRRAGNFFVFGKPNDCVMVSLETYGTQDCYNVLRLNWTRKNTSTVTFTIDLTAHCLKGSAKVTTPDLPQGGYWWAYIKDWYNWKPDASLVWQRVLEVLKTCGQD